MKKVNIFNYHPFLITSILFLSYNLHRRPRTTWDTFTAQFSFWPDFAGGKKENQHKMLEKKNKKLKGPPLNDFSLIYQRSGRILRKLL